MPAPPLVDAPAAVPSLRTLGTSSTSAAAGDDSRLVSATSQSFSGVKTFNDGIISKANIGLVSLAAPGALTVALAGLGAGNLNNGIYYYRVTFVTAYGETDQGTASAPITIVDKTTNGQVALSNIPVSADSRVTGRKLYRCSVGGGSFATKLLTTINDNVTTVYTDNIADGALGATAPIINTTAAITTASYLSITNVNSYDTAISIPNASVMKMGAASINGDPSSNIIYIGNLTVASTLTATNLTSTSTSGPVTIVGAMTDGATAIGAKINTPAYSDGSAKLLSIQNNSVEKAYVTKDGGLGLVGSSGTTRIFGSAAAAPVGGTWALGDIIFDSNPIPGGNVGWICTTGGSPGVWNSFGIISL
jgi:hypothetical protein